MVLIEFSRVFYERGRGLLGSFVVLEVGKRSFLLVRLCWELTLVPF